MSAPKFTPEIWKPSPRIPYLITVDGNPDRPVAQIRGNNLERKARSRLIASAPELYEACLLAQGYLRNQGASESDPLLLGAINAALAKAVA